MIGLTIIALIITSVFHFQSIGLMYNDADIHDHWVKLDMLKLVKRPFMSNGRMVEEARKLEKYIYNIKEAEIVPLRIVEKGDK